MVEARPIIAIFKLITNPLSYLRFIFFIFAVYACYRSYKTYKKTKQSSALFMFFLVLLFTLNLISQALDIEQFIMLTRQFRLNLILSFLPIITFLAFDYVQRKRHKAELQHEKVRNMFKRYVNPYIVDELVKKEDLKLEGKRQNVSVLFVDIRGFTPLAERLTAEKVVSLLNKYFKAVTNAIFKYNGTVDKFIGDAVMAFYNAPLQQKDHADRAVRSAIEIQKEIEKLNKFLSKDKLKINIGIGINTGEAVIGNVGTEQFLDYTAIGDTVNTASRLQGKANAKEILISESTRKAISDKTTKMKDVGNFELKGKAKPIKAYKIIY
ncbi:MAG: adenylate/guanylate cyclase domain-containing protein [Nanoarchaeota archaeon]